MKKRARLWNLRFSVNFSTFSYICEDLRTFVNTFLYRLCHSLRATFQYITN